MAIEESIKNEKKNEFITFDPSLKLSRMKKFRMKQNIRKQNFKKFRETNKYWNYYISKIEDIFNYSIPGTLIALPFFIPNPILVGLAIGAGTWLYINRFHKELKEILGAFRLSTSIGYK